MRSNNQITRQIWQRIEQFPPILQKLTNYLSLGLEGKQWLACVMICAMLLPMFSLPVSARIFVSISDNSGQFEPVNEQPSILTEIWRNLNAKYEALTTPYRTDNVLYSDDKKKNPGKVDEKINSEEKTGKKAGEEKFTAKKTDPKKAEKTTIALSDEKTKFVPAKVENENKTPENTKIKNVVASASLVLNQLPDDERDSIYNYENNLGSPPGQTEMDSTNEAVAIRIKHRVGIANFNFGIPLASLSGRGINTAVGLTYNSRTWNKSVTVDPNNPNGTIDHFTYDVEESWIAPGFSSGLGYLNSYLNTRTVLIMQGGNAVNKTLTEIIPEGITSPDGTRHQISCKTWSQIPGGHQTAQYCTAFETNDGSLIRIVRSGTTYSIGGMVNYANTKFTVTYRDGSKVYYLTPFGSTNNRKYYPLIVQDSNGNRIRVAYKADQSGRIDFITDTLNRKIKFYYENDTSGNPNKLVAVTIPGMGTNEEIQTVRFYYEEMTLNSQGKFTGQTTAPPTIRVLRYVFMPSTKTGYKYDYHSNYGMIKKITRLVGMTVSDVNSLNTTGTVTNDGNWAAATEYNFPDGSTVLTDVPKYTKRTDDWQGRTSSQPQETFYHAPEPNGGDRLSQITVKDNGFDVMTENISGFDGLLKETSVIKRYGPENPVTRERPYTQLMSKTKYTWSGSRNLTKTEFTNEAGLIRATEYEYDQYNNQTKVKEYDYAASDSLGTLLKTTEIEYETGSGWINANLLGLTKSVKIIVNSVTVSKTLYEYDHNGSDSTIVRRDDIDTGTHDTFYNPAHPAWDEEVCPFYDPDTRYCQIWCMTDFKRRF